MSSPLIAACFLVSLILLAPFGLAGEPVLPVPETTVAFLYNGREYSPEFLLDVEEAGSVPPELKEQARSGDRLGYRRQEEGKPAEEIAGAIGKDEKVRLANGIEFSTEGMTVYQVLQRLMKIYFTIHVPDAAYINDRPGKKPTLPTDEDKVLIDDYPRPGNDQK